MDELITCTPMYLPEEEWAEAAKVAAWINPCNAVMPACLPDAIYDILPPGKLAVLTQKYWGAEGARLGVAFLDNPNAATRRMILQYANIWAQYANVEFFETTTDPVIRILRGEGGYWSYLGTDNLRIRRGQQTMNLQGFTERTVESEFLRVVPHEFGHALGFPHEHMRREVVALLDPQKTIAWGREELGWSAQMVQQQILTPLEDGSLMATERADLESIMCYQLPGRITRTGQPIPGGNTLSASDREFVGKIYPKPRQPEPPAPPPVVGGVNVVVDPAEKVVKVTAAGYRVFNASPN